MAPRETENRETILANKDGFQAVALAEKTKGKRFSRRQVSLGILQDGQGTKQALAEFIAPRFLEELGFQLLCKHRLWTSENYQMDIRIEKPLCRRYLRRKI